MKKVYFLILGMAAAFAGCKKDHTCTCTYTYDGESYTRTYMLGKTSKSDAKSQCSAVETNEGWSSYGGSCSVN